MNEIKKVVNSKANVIKLLSVSETAPINCIQGDMYYNTSTNLIYISNATNTWSEEGKEPIEGYLYVDLEKAKMYYYDGTFFANYGGTSNEIVISEEQPTTEDWKIWINPDEPINNLGSEVVDTLEGNETNKAPSVNAVNKRFVYSSEEILVGNWYEYPLYRKVVMFGSLPNASTKSVAHNISNLGAIVNIEGRASNGTNFFPLPYIPSNIAQGISYYVDKTNINITTGNDRSDYSGYITLYYTKSTN